VVDGEREATAVCGALVRVEPEYLSPQRTRLREPAATSPAFSGDPPISDEPPPRFVDATAAAQLRAPPVRIPTFARPVVEFLARTG
jgi:hypothetical protein